MFERELSAYCAEAERSLQCSKAQKQKFRRHIWDCAQDYLTEQPGADFDEVRGMLGEPQEAAALYMDTLPGDTALRWQQARRIRRVLLIAALALAAAVLAGSLLYLDRSSGLVIINTKTTYIDRSSSSQAKPPLRAGVSETALPAGGAHV